MKMNKTAPEALREFADFLDALKPGGVQAAIEPLINTAMQRAYAYAASKAREQAEMMERENCQHSKK
jgi:hypothetical protein